MTFSVPRERDLEHLVSLLSERWVLSLATVDATGATYSTPLYYALVSSGPVAPALVFVSDPATAHGHHLGCGPTSVSAATYLETRAVPDIRGVQMRGTVERQDRLHERRIDGLKNAYLHAHPVAQRALDATSPPSLYLFTLRWAKLTDNRQGMGKHTVLTFSDGERPA